MIQQHFTDFIGSTEHCFQSACRWGGATNSLILSLANLASSWLTVNSNHADSMSLWPLLRRKACMHFCVHATRTMQVLRLVLPTAITFFLSDFSVNMNIHVYKLLSAYRLLELVATKFENMVLMFTHLALRSCSGSLTDRRHHSPYGLQNEQELRVDGHICSARLRVLRGYRGPVLLSARLSGVTIARAQTNCCWTASVTSAYFAGLDCNLSFQSHLCAV